MAGLVVTNTSKILAQFGPAILSTQYWEATKNKFLPRLQAEAGPHKSGADPHIAGRALDIFLFADKPDERMIADKLVSTFRSLRLKMKFISVKYNHMEFNGADQSFPQPKDKAHETHIHIEWGSGSMNHTGFEDDLKAAVQSINDYEFD